MNSLSTKESSTSCLTLLHSELDDTLIDRFLANRNQEDFSKLYHKHMPKIYAKCILMLKNDQLALDACQEVFIKIYLNLAKFNKRSKFSTWIYSITNNVCLDYLRQKEREPKFVSIENYKLIEIEDNTRDYKPLEKKIKKSTKF